MTDLIDALTAAIGRAESAEVRVARADVIRYQDGKARHEASHLREAIQQYRLAISDVKQVWRELHDEAHEAPERDRTPEATTPPGGGDVEQ